MPSLREILVASSPESPMSRLTDYLAKTSFPETLRGLVHKGGLRAQIVESGTIRTGDSIVVL